MEFKQLQYFVTSVDLGSFKKAADALYTTQPHISKTIKALEQELGMALLDRHPAGVTATEAGKQVYAYASDILLKCGQLAQIETAGQYPPLHIAAVPSGYLTGLAAGFCARWDGPALDVSYHEGSLDEIIQRLHRHEANLGLILLPGRRLAGFVQRTQKKRLTLEVLRTGAPCLIVGPGHPLYMASQVDRAALRTQPLFQPPDGLLSWQTGALVGRDAHAGPAGRIQVGSTLMAEQLIRAGLLAAVGCAWMVKDGLRAVPVQRLDEKLCLGCLQRQREDLSGAEQEFLGFVRGQSETE